MDNNAKSCVSILLAKPGNFWHNFRRGFLPNDCHKELVHENEYTCSFEEARRLAKRMRDDAVAAYQRKYNQKPQFDEEKIFWEASINAREYHTLDDLRKAGKIIEKKTGYRMVYGAIHRDEGHLNDEGVFVKNTHFQVLLISLDENGNSMHRVTRGKRQLMRDIQTEVARVLNMERGIDKRISGREHLTPRQYKQAVKLQEPLKQELKLTKADLKTAKERIKQLEGQLKTANLDARNELKAQGASRPDYAKLEAENAKLKDELAAFKKTTDNVSVDDFVKLFEEKIKKLRNHPKIDVEVEKAIKANNLRSGILGAFDKNSIMAYIADSVATKQAALNTIKDAQAALKKAAVKKEIDAYEQLKALRENKIAGALFGAVSKPAVDVDALQSENASLLKTFDFLQKQNKDLQTALEKATSLINQKNTGLEKPQKNQEVVKQLDDSFFRGQAMLLSQLIRNKQLYIEPKGQHLVESLNDIVNGETPFSRFEGIKSGLLTYCPASSSPKNDLEI
ncbi:MAG: mobilization protein [Campylobacter sp.]|uniref:mobilization protein n=1 Tax=Campylobacter sp. TaxID=205 RepID=UPI003FA15977